ncbi:MAG: ABC transporter ATP-binding protein [Phycisphaerales bacterium]
MAAPVVDIRTVSKRYGRKVHALREVALQVGAGEVFGLLGPNGAGKSTLVKILMTVVRPTRAEGSLLGAPLGTKGVLARVGYLPEHHRFPRYLTGRQLVEFFGALAKVRRPERRRRAEELLELVGLRKWADTRVTSYSKGMQQRAGLAMALVNDPALVLLDEPTDGVDPVGRREIRDLLVRMRSEGRTVFINSHLLSEIEMVCDRVAIMVQGRVVRQGTLRELTAASRYELAFTGLSAAEVPSGLGALAVRRDGDLQRATLPTSDPAVLQPVLDWLRGAGAVVVSVVPFRESLEDVFIREVQDPATGAALPPGAAR